MSQLPPFEPDKLSPHQRRVYDAIASGPRGGVRGPFVALMQVPGYYIMMGMTLLAHEVALPAGMAPPLK